MNFKKSPVIFDEAEHTYHLGDRQLLGITGLIHSILGLGVYPEASDYTRDYVIPRAGSRGTAVHHAIETYDKLGIRQTEQIVTTRFGSGLGVTYEDMTWDVSNELDRYIMHKRGFRALANELTVSDNEKWASQIDNVWLNEKTEGIWLVDTKTNNIALYPLCGYFNPHCFRNGEEALKEYLSWQLSIYAELFESENPDHKVEGLACNWLRNDDGAFWTIGRKPSELVWELLKTEYIITDNGASYFHPNLEAFGIRKDMPVPNEETTPIVAPDVVEYVSTLMRQYKEAEQKLDEAKKALRAAMEVHQVKSYDFGSFSATLSADSTSTTFDTKRFKTEHPDLYKQYSVSKERKGSLTLKTKENGN